MMKRRDFLMASGLVLLSGKEAFEFLNDIYKQENKHLIYSELPKLVHLGEMTAKVKADDREFDINRKGCGVIKGDEYWSMAHIFCDTNMYMNTPFGRIELPTEKISSEMKLYDKTLDEIVGCKESDVARFKLPDRFGRDCRFREFPGELVEPRAGMDVYVIGNPYLRGANVRKAHISELDGFDEAEISKDCFGIDVTVHPGDSGTPVVDDKGNLLGLCCLFAGADLGYIKPIRLWGGKE